MRNAEYQLMTNKSLTFATVVLASAAFLSLTALPHQASSQVQETIDAGALKPVATGYADSAEGLRVYYEVYGEANRL
jgi:hypothetical protein